jgi:hypothetical protein
LWHKCQPPDSAFPAAKRCGNALLLFNQETVILASLSPMSTAPRCCPVPPC